MKLLITLELVLLLFASTFRSHNPPGWYQVQLPVNGIIKDIKFIDKNTGWVAVDRLLINNDTSYILNTTDSGESWRVQFRGAPFSINIVDFVDENTGYAGGTSLNGKFMMRTTNGGENWTTIFDELGIEVSDLDFVDSEFGWYCEDDFLFGGGVFRTTDGGNTWQRLTEPGSFLKLFFLNRDTGWVLTGERLFRTFNGGLNWTQNGVFDVGMKDLSFLSVDSGWVIRNSDNGIYRTTNAGMTWLREGDPYPLNSGLGEIQMISGTKGWIPNAVRGMFAINSEGIWGRQSIPGNNNYFRVSFVDSVSGYAGGVRFSRTDDGGGIITSNNQQLHEIPASFRLHQNYPNPFNPSTTIRFGIRTSGNVSLKVHDVLGREVAVLADEYLRAGSYERVFDAGNLSSGVYFYTLRLRSGQALKAGEFEKTLRMVVVR